MNINNTTFKNLIRDIEQEHDIHKIKEEINRKEHREYKGFNKQYRSEQGSKNEHAKPF